MNTFSTRDTAFYIFLVLQILFWWHTHKERPGMDIVTTPPTLTQARALSLGDEQFYFRVQAFRLQNFGDTFGRITPLKDYDFALLAKWFVLMDSLDTRSNIIPALASYYYSATQRTEDNRYIVDYLASHFEQDPASKWWWMTNAIRIAKYKLKDKELALKLAYRLAEAGPDDMPIWARQMPAFILADMGEKETARKIMEDIARNYHDLSDKELNYMRFFIEERLKEDLPDFLREK